MRLPALVESYRRRTQSSAHSPVRLVTAPCGRARQMNEGAKASRGEISPLSPCRHAASRRCQNDDRDDAGRSTDGGRTVRCPIRSPIDVGNHHQQDDELALETERHRHRRSSPVRASSIFEQMGGFADMPLMEDIEFLPQTQTKGSDRGPHRDRDHLLSSMGTAWTLADNPLDVDLTVPVLDWREPSHQHSKSVRME